MRSGFTLVEVLVAMAILAVISVYLTEMMTRQSRAYQVVDQVTEAQQNLRAIAELIERDLRSTATMVPEAAALCGLDQVTGSDYLFVTDYEALNFDNVYLYDLGQDIQSGFDGVGNDTLVLDDGPGSQLHAADDELFYDLDGNGTPDSDFRQSGGVNGIQGGVIVVDAANPDRGSACGIITNVNIGAESLTVDFGLQGNSGTGPNALTTLRPVLPGMNTPRLVAVPAHWYTVDATRQLLRDNQVLATSVDDLQFSAFYDLNDDGIPDANEIPGTAGVAAYDSSLWDNTELDEIRVNLVVTTRSNDREFQKSGQGEFIETENRQLNPINDGLRRRVHTASVRPRNVGGRL
jgi:prepilin-type N-terminal cleavage/methylation domain-containing protein